MEKSEFRCIDHGCGSAGGCAAPARRWTLHRRKTPDTVPIRSIPANI